MEAKAPEKGCKTGERGRTLLEALLVLILISILLFLAVDRFTSSVRPVKEAALQIELSNLRSAINFYATLNGKLPATLKILLNENAIVPKRDIEGDKFRLVLLGKYVESMTADKDGYPTDPFGNRYAYDPATGMVRSSTRGYEKW